ncbi:DUF3472 domain-containing protein [Flagellimonas onchidii]|uniref:DUF3472 domain-containing protein n=1 Tax=Flagellimonas onchidii TaxID=2562684 RepID=UPI0010A5C323|nr:DUF3472 domain-containing protein [Allomuricauda onchidii]
MEKVIFSNQWAIDKDAQWYEITKATFTGDVTVVNRAKLDYDRGVESNAYLRNCDFSI